jgi:RNA polymerase sigma-70 factor (ECF subfamily)
VVGSDLLADIEGLYRRDFARFVRVARALVGEEQLALDVVQQAFVRAVDKRRSFRGRGPLEAWVWRIVLNEARKQATADRRESLTYAEPGASNGQPAADAAVRAAVAALPERQRLAIFLRYYADLDYSTIAEALDVERGTVSATLSAAHHSLRLRLKEGIA